MQKVGMGSLHLRCNRRLFFSGILYITLIVGVCLIHTLSSISNFVSFSSSIISPTTHDSCINNVNDVVFDAKVNPFQDINESTSSSLSWYTKSWSWAKSKRAVSCGFQKLDRSNANKLLNGSWIVVAGDSQARNFYLSFLERVFESKRTRWVKECIYRRRKAKRFEDYRFVVDDLGMKLEFVLAKFEANLSSLVGEFKEKRHYPDVLVMGSGLWHMLYYTNVSDYGVGLRFLRSSIASLSKVGDIGTSMVSTSRAPHMFWLGMPVLVNKMLHTEEKKKKLTNSMWHAYYREVIQSKHLRQYGGGPFLFLNLSSLSWNCGPQCTSDGMHYNGAVYEAAVQIMFNALLIESHQKF